MSEIQKNDPTEFVVPPQPTRLKVYWISQLGTKPFEQPVNTVEEGVFLLNTLAQYDLHQLEHKIRGDFANAGGLMMFDPEDANEENPDGQWCDWYDYETGESDPNQFLLDQKVINNVPETA